MMTPAERMRALRERRRRGLRKLRIEVSEEDPVGYPETADENPLPKRSAASSATRLPASTAPADFRPNDQLRRNVTALPHHVTTSHTPLHRQPPVGKYCWAGGGAGRGPAGTRVSTQRRVRTATSRASPSRKVQFPSHRFDFAWNFPPRRSSRRIVRWSVLRMIWRPGVLPMVPQRVHPKLLSVAGPDAGEAVGGDGCLVEANATSVQWWKVMG
jgi:hypothetical protein